jgi:S1-C subfamily serine protease
MEIDEAQRQSVATPGKWGMSLSRAFKAVVVLRVTVTRDFDTVIADVYNATGFIIDKQRRIILTNMHVVQSRPDVADAKFPNCQNIPVYPLYRDPVHDFGFFRFYPSTLKFMEPEEIPLAPEATAVGLEIRVVGNVSEEMLSVFPGTIARLDRQAPRYNTDGYNDFNTFYMQAASGTRGGSSGSPVIYCDAQVVGLNVSSKTPVSFFLPLDRVVRALKILQRYKDKSNIGWQATHIPRGTLQMTLLHRGFDEVLSLGILGNVDQLVRKDFLLRREFL